MRPLHIGFAALTALALSAGAAIAQPLKITVSPRLPTASDRIEVTVSGSVVCTSRPDSPNDEPLIEEGRVILPLISTICDPPVPYPLSETYSVGPLPAGTWVLEVLEDGQFSRGKRTLDVAPVVTDLLLHDGRFKISVDWSTPDGSLKGSGYAVPTSDGSGYFWFFGGQNPEILVKVLNGVPVNGRWWVFISSNTNLRFKVEVAKLSDIADPPGYCLKKTYESPAGANKNFIDTTTFGRSDC